MAVSGLARGARGRFDASARAHVEARGMGESSKPARAAWRRAGARFAPGRALLFGQTAPSIFERWRCEGNASN